MRFQWHYDSDGNKTHTMLQKQNPFIFSRKWEIHASKKAAVPSDVSSLGDAVIPFVADERIRQPFSTR